MIFRLLVKCEYSDKNRYGDLCEVKVILYKTTHCPRCVEMKKRLEALRIDYEEKNIETDSDAMADVLMLGKWVMPILTRDGKLVDIEKLVKELKETGS